MGDERWGARLFSFFRFCGRRKTAGSLEPGARSMPHRDRDVRWSDVRHQTVTRMFAFSSQTQDS